jgi:hypothetical protein
MAFFPNLPVVLLEKEGPSPPSPVSCGAVPLYARCETGELGGGSNPVAVRRQLRLGRAPARFVVVAGSIVALRSRYGPIVSSWW